MIIICIIHSIPFLSRLGSSRAVILLIFVSPGPRTLKVLGVYLLNKWRNIRSILNSKELERTLLTLWLIVLSTDFEKTTIIPWQNVTVFFKRLNISFLVGPLSFILSAVYSSSKPGVVSLLNQWIILSYFWGKKKRKKKEGSMFPLSYCEKNRSSSMFWCVSLLVQVHLNLASGWCNVGNGISLYTCKECVLSAMSWIWKVSTNILGHP